MEPQRITSGRWRQVKEVFQTAIELEPASRASYLADACGGDLSLRAEVESLINAHEEPGSFLDTPAADLAAAEPSLQARSLVGSSLGRYQILELLGRGGMGEVYRARDTMLGREVAIKVLPSAFSLDRNQLHRFQQEARSVSALNHPNIITIYEFGQDNGVHFIASELIEGETLRQRLAHAPLAPDAIVEIALQIASALVAAHEAGIVHRDIKPENVMIRPDGLVKVLDFGLAKSNDEANDEEKNEEQGRTKDRIKDQVNDRAKNRVKDETEGASDAAAEDEISTAIWGGTETGMILGTINYMSPEQARGQRLDARSDIFSLGVVLYEMAAGRSPFARATQADAIAAILETEPPLLAQVAPRAPRRLEQVITRALRKDRAERYQTAAELLADLKSVRGSEEPGALLQTARSGKISSRAAGWRSAALIVLLALVAAALAALEINRGAAPIGSIAVLPFTNADRNAETEYLSDGMMEHVIDSLSQLSALKVRPRNSVLRYRGRTVDPIEAGRDLDVEAVLTGEVATRGEEITISLELIDVRENRRLWGGTYSGRERDLLLTETRIARELAENLRLRLSSHEQQRLSRRQTDNPAANQAYLKGRYLWNRRASEGHSKAMEFFMQAIELDPSFALAHAALADCYVLGGNYRISVHEAMSKARALSERALELDETLAEAHASLAQVKLFADWNLAGAEESFKRAIELKPGYETAHHWYAIMLAISGRFAEAIERIKLAQELDPVSLIITKDAGLIYYYAGDYEQAIAQCRKTLDLAPDFFSAYSALGDIYLRMGRRAEAFAALRRADELSHGRPYTKAALAYAYARAGERGRAMAMLEELRRGSAGRPVSAYYRALVSTGLGDKDEAFRWFEQALEERSYRMIYLNVDPAFESLRSDDRFASLIERIGLDRPGRD